MKSRTAVLINLLSVLLLAVCAGAAHAGIRVEPMSYDLRPAGSGSSQTIRVQNTGDRPMPVELRVQRREVRSDGTTVTTPADDDFIIFPPQGVVPPNGFQSFRIQYVAAPPARSVLYSVVVSQLPIQAGPSDSGVQILFNIGTLAAVSPDEARADVVVTEVAPAEAADKVRITVENRGTRYARLRGGRWTFTSADGRTEILEGEALNAALEQPLIEAQSSRVIELPVPAGFDRTGARAEYRLPDTR
jgi:fimbrial chaperone protein